MSYAMRKTPRSSFMSMGDDIATTVVRPIFTSPPIYQNDVMRAPAPPTTPTTDVSSGLGKYVLLGGAAVLAYWLYTKR